jgi:hypothetical protein
MKRIQVVFTDEAWTIIETVSKQASTDFDAGSISWSDVVNELVLTARVDIKTLQMKHIDLRRSLKSFASKKDIDIDLIIKTLTELKGKPAKRKMSPIEQEVKNA